MLKSLLNHGYNWLEVGKDNSKHSLFSLENHWRKVVKSKATPKQIDMIEKTTPEPLKKGKFRRFEELLLWKLIRRNGFKWEQFQERFFPSKTVEEVEGQWENEMKPNLSKKQQEMITKITEAPAFVKRGAWSKDEDKLLRAKYRQYKENWSKIAPFFQGRSEESVKKRCTKLFSIKKAKKSSNEKEQWTEREDSILTEEKLKGTPNQEIANMLNKRSKQSIASRWMRIRTKKGIETKRGKASHSSDSSSTDSDATSTTE